MKASYGEGVASPASPEPCVLYGIDTTHGGLEDIRFGALCHTYVTGYTQEVSYKNDVRLSRSPRMAPYRPSLGTGVSARSRAPLTLPCSPPGQPGAWREPACTLRECVVAS